MSAPSIITLATLLTAAAAQTTSIVSLPFYGLDPQVLVGSVVTAEPSGLTTLALGCAVSDDSCGLFPYQTLVVGPSTYNMAYSDDEFTMTQACETASALCAESAGGASANFPGSSTTSYDPTDIATIPVTITAGVAQLAASAGASATTTSGASHTGTASSSGSVTLVTGTSSTAKATGTSTSASGSSSSHSAGAASSSSSTGSAAPTSSSSAAQPRMVVVGGGVVAAAVGLMGALL